MITMISRNMPYGMAYIGTSMDGLHGYVVFDRDYKASTIDGVTIADEAPQYRNYSAWATHAYWFAKPCHFQAYIPYYFYDDFHKHEYVEHLSRIRDSVIQHGFANDDEHVWWKMKWEGAK